MILCVMMMRVRRLWRVDLNGCAVHSLYLFTQVEEQNENLLEKVLSVMGEDEG